MTRKPEKEKNYRYKQMFRPVFISELKKTDCIANNTNHNILCMKKILTLYTESGLQIWLKFEHNFPKPNANVNQKSYIWELDRLVD